MTNLQEEVRGPLIGDRLAQRLVFWGPIGGGALLALLVLLFGIVPSWLRIGSLQDSLQTAADLASLLPEARLQLDQERRRNERIQRQRATLLNLIGRPGTLATFLTELDRLAALHQVQIDLYEPQAAPAAGAAATTPPAPGSAGTPPVVAPDRSGAGRTAPPVLQVEGLQRTSLLLSARGRYPALLAFLRSLERLDVLVAQSSLSLALEPTTPDQAAAPSTPAAPAAGAPAATPQAAQALPPPPPLVVLKLAIGLYEPAQGTANGSQLPGRP